METGVRMEPSPPVDVLSRSHWCRGCGRPPERVRKLEQHADICHPGFRVSVEGRCKNAAFLNRMTSLLAGSRFSFCSYRVALRSALHDERKRPLSPASQ